MKAGSPPCGPSLAIHPRCPARFTKSDDEPVARVHSTGLATVLTKKHIWIGTEDWQVALGPPFTYADGDNPLLVNCILLENRNRTMIHENIWYWDHALRDIYVLGVIVADWQRVVDWLHTDPYPIAFYVDGQPAPLPRDISAVIEQRNEIDVFLEIDVQGVIIHCHFFWPKEIEFDLDPRQVNTEEKEQGVIEFIRALGRLLGQEVILTPENWRESPFLRYIPEGDQVDYYDVSLEPGEVRELSREEWLKLMAKAYGMDEIDEAAIIKKMLEAVNKPAYEED
jgi:hypothetical protein